eukprot:gnl/Chilomastix_caulleri/1115.p1 GENE.gnl/Chilomastix_caulleri/1115~~gnl/Chilomastix_caulleri/1115.p1  ORF type:complete len:143 (+),score=40.38 gnl/Chilomastix_caulleri/1115:195-623(+)
MGILNLGLKIAPDTARNTGKRLGFGVYLADNNRKAKAYTQRGVTGTGFIFIVEASYNKAYELYDSSKFHVMSPTLQPIKGTDATILHGTFEPTTHSMYYDDASIPFPIGEFRPTGHKCTDTNTEYCIYDQRHLKLRYLVTIK